MQTREGCETPIIFKNNYYYGISLNPFQNIQNREFQRFHRNRSSGQKVRNSDSKKKCLIFLPKGGRMKKRSWKAAPIDMLSLLSDATSV